MSSPLQFARSLGIINDEDENQENIFDDSFSNFSNSLDQPSGSIVSGGKEDLYHKYNQLLQQESGSERVFQDYIGRRPTEDAFKPGVGRGIAAALVGLSTGLGRGLDRANPVAAYQATQGIVREPYERAYKTWGDEGRLIDDQMRFAEGSRQRGLQGILSQIRMGEVERANRAREESNTILRNIQQQNADAKMQRDADEMAAKEEERKLRGRGLDIQERGLGETTRHHKVMELKSTGSSEKDTEAELKKYNKMRDTPELLQYLGFGAPESEANARPLINPFTGKFYTEIEMSRMGPGR